MPRPKWKPGDALPSAKSRHHFPHNESPMVEVKQDNGGRDPAARRSPNDEAPPEGYGDWTWL